MCVDTGVYVCAFIHICIFLTIPGVKEMFFTSTTIKRLTPYLVSDYQIAECFPYALPMSELWALTSGLLSYCHINTLREEKQISDLVIGNACLIVLRFCITQTEWPLFPQISVFFLLLQEKKCSGWRQRSFWIAERIANVCCILCSTSTKIWFWLLDFLLQHLKQWNEWIQDSQLGFSTLYSLRDALPALHGSACSKSLIK